MPALKAIGFIVFAFLFQSHILGQPYYFRHYTVENGLSNNAVMCSLQDRMGFLWFGTKDGLNRFDGYSFKTFRKTYGKPWCIGNNFIRSLYEDRQGALWIGTERGLYRYMEKTEIFSLVPATTAFSISNLAQDSNGNFWFISGFSLCRYSKQTGKLECYDQRKYFVATSICIGSEGIVWVGTVDGYLKRYHPENNSFSSFYLYEHSKPATDRYIESLYQTSNGDLIAGTHNLGIKLVNARRNYYTDLLQPFASEKTTFVRTIMQTAPDEFWLGAETGIYIYNHKTGKLLHLQKDYNDPFSLSDNIVHTLWRDREGGIWIGTYFGGVNYYPNQYTLFKKFFPKKFENALSGNIAREIKKDQYGNLWIGTEDAGLNKLDPAGVFTHYQPTGSDNSISSNNVHGLLAAEDELWIGTFDGGLDVMNIRTGKVMKHFRAGPGSDLEINFIYCIYQTPAGQILIGTPLGVYVYNREKDKLERLKGLPPWDWYSSILMDRSGTLWATTLGRGVHFYNPATGKGGSFTHNDTIPNSLSNDRVNAVFEDSKNNLWFATEDGLCVWNPSTRKFRRYGTYDGFPSDFMLSILEDEKENLWITTTRGLVRFHPVSGKPQVYTTTNGLLSDQFNFNSAFKDANGAMYFGSVKGLISFLPGQFRQNNFAPPVFLTELQIKNAELPIAGKGSPLKQSITLTDDLTLAYDQSTFSIHFAALSYTAPEMTQYSYKMEGLSNEWVSLKTKRSVSFTELPPGAYTFWVKTVNSDGIGSKKEAKLTIHILPPWWASTWAYIAYVLLVVLLLYNFVHAYHRRMKEKNRRKIELLKMEKEKEILKLELSREKELLQAKLDFFTNVAHEIKTPLTLIKAPLHKVIKKAGNVPGIENSLKIMDRNTQRLIDLTNQLLDFRQIEMDKFHLSFETTDVTRLLTEACAGFTTLAEQDNKSLTLQMPETSFFAFVDADAFNKIVYNLFSNAVKYAESKVHIALLPGFKNSNTFTVVVKNDGYLIPEELKEKIFEPFFRMREIESQTGNGIGLALSRSLAALHKGALVLEPPEDNMNVFSLTLPIQSENYTVADNKS